MRFKWPQRRVSGRCQVWHCKHDMFVKKNCKHHEDDSLGRIFFVARRGRHESYLLLHTIGLREKTSVVCEERQLHSIREEMPKENNVFPFSLASCRLMGFEQNCLRGNGVESGGHPTACALELSVSGTVEGQWCWQEQLAWATPIHVVYMANKPVEVCCWINNRGRIPLQVREREAEREMKSSSNTTKWRCVR